MDKQRKYDLETIYERLRLFIEFADRKERGCSQWIENKTAKIYVRKGYHLIEGDIRVCLDIATVEVNEKYCKQGIFSEILKTFHEKNPWEYTFVENVMEQWLVNSVRKRGYSEVRDSGTHYDLPVSLYRSKKD